MVGGTVGEFLFRLFFPGRIRVTWLGVKVTLLRSDVERALGYAQAKVTQDKRLDIEDEAVAALRIIMGADAPRDGALREAVRRVRGVRA